LKRTLFYVAAVTLMVASAAAQSEWSPAASKLAAVLPFENQSRAPGLEWVGESFPETLGPRFSAAQMLVVGRQDRLYAFERAGLPTGARISRATLFRLTEEMDADYAVVGSYNFDGRTFTARAQLMDVKRLRLLPEVVESGALTQLLEIQNALAWNLLRQLNLVQNTPKNNFIASAAQIRLDALENYVRGMIAVNRIDRAKFLRQAVRVSPNYADAQLQLGKTLFEGNEYESAIAAFATIPSASLLYGEAQFYTGLANYYIGRYEPAEGSFKAVSDRVPLIEVYNNLGVVTARLGKKEAREYFLRAAQADSRDADYRFNLGVTLYRNGDLSGAQRQLRDVVGLRPNDEEAKALLQQVSASVPFPKDKPPLERVKRNYDESSYRQLASEIAAMRELRFAALPAPEHAAAHVRSGMELLGGDNLGPAENEFREAILLDPTNHEAHAGLARVLEAQDELAEARAEANAANRLKVSADAFLVLARIDLKQNKPESAEDNLMRALRVDPSNTEAAAVRQGIERQKVAQD
jgi:tetratricopeptide (TPR) repeat protein